MIEQVSFDRGIHLRGTLLWFDAEIKRGICVLTGLPGARLPPRHARAVGSTDLARVLERGGYGRRVLPAAWERWVGLGGRQVCLLPVASVVGCAVAQVSTGKQRMVFAGCLRAMPLKWPKCDLVVATTPALSHRGAAYEQVVRGLGIFAEQAIAEKARAVVLTDSLEVAVELCVSLQNHGLLPTPLGLVAKLWEAAEAGGAKAQPHVSVALSNAKVSAKARVAWVDTGLGSFGAGQPKLDVAATFRLRWFADWAVLKNAVTMTGARSVVLTGVANQLRAKVVQQLGDGIEVALLGAAKQLALAPS
ncbi:MAG: hypothetical protein A2289_26840 [Deltaproteobacteria bacterium RIFOXYA12_FULL_58_15]|nr:MAG: hypothetical protein A2289_26840 [Deltaproteobacteria bacterium RIFOXYA12_FULL_58_15]OGR09325.1 MAG: hypothetical protein A2341_02125 [Deltaproteobacteria bacterium RIFOXYB12_FULL_58_9]